MIKSDWLWRKQTQGRIPTPIQSWGREHFIPIRMHDLIAQLASLDPSSLEQGQSLEKLFRQLVILVHQRYRSRHKQLVSLYQGFDPDLDVTPARLNAQQKVNPIQQDLDSQQLFSEIADSLQHANYRRLKPREIQQALNVASHWGVRLKIRFSSFRRLEVYGRGDIVARRLKRDGFFFWRLREVDVPIYQRLVVVFRTKELQSLPELLDPNCIHVRMFKNIPKLDVDMMLPGSQVKISWMDTGKIGVPTLWGLLVLASKLAKSIWLLALLGAVKFFSSFLLVFAIALASVFYGIKSVFSYSTAKRRYQLNIARNLYYQNLDNNFGAILRLIDEAEQQESCEAILAYFVLIKSSSPYMTESEVDLEAERLLELLTGIEIDFDVQDALRDLLGIGIVQLTGEGWKAMSLEESTERTSIARVHLN